MPCEPHAANFPRPRALHRGLFVARVPPLLPVHFSHNLHPTLLYPVAATIALRAPFHSSLALISRPLECSEGRTRPCPAELDQSIARSQKSRTLCKPSDRQPARPVFERCTRSGRDVILAVKMLADGRDGELIRMDERTMMRFPARTRCILFASTVSIPHPRYNLCPLTLAGNGRIPEICPSHSSQLSEILLSGSNLGTGAPVAYFQASVVATPFIRSRIATMETRYGLSPQLHVREPTGSRERVHLVDSDMLVAEAPPLDLEDDLVYLNGRHRRKTSRSPILCCSLSNSP